MLRLVLACAAVLTIAMSLSPGLHSGSTAIATSSKLSRAASTKPLPELVAFAHAWRGVTAYSATMTIFEEKGSKTQNMVFDYHFRKPSSVTVRVVVGVNTGARLAWEGGSTVLVRRGAGLLALLKKTVSLHDPLVTTIRGSTVNQLSFASILAHSGQPGLLSESHGEVINGVATDAVTLIPTQPSADANFSREVIEISTATHLPARVFGYEGSALVRKIDISDVRLIH